MSIETVVSTDIIGIWGDIKNLNYIYGNLTDRLEIIGWAATLDAHLSRARELGYEAVNIHGRLTSYCYPDSLIHKIPSLLANQFITSTADLIQYGNNHDILLHSPVLYDPNIFRLIVTNRDKIRFLWLENENNGLHGALDTIGMIQKLTTAGVRTGLTFDLYHFISNSKEANIYFSSSWKKTVSFILNNLMNLKDSEGKLIPLTLHFPVGTNRSDALPILSDMTIGMLRDLADITNSGRIKRIVIENQQNGIFKHFRINTKDLNIVRNRTLSVLNKMAAAGIL